MQPARERLSIAKSGVSPARTNTTHNLQNIQLSPLAEWTFDHGPSDTFGKLPLTITGAGRIESGALLVDGQAMAESGSLAKSRTSKTIEAGVKQERRWQQGGGERTWEGLIRNVEFVDRGEVVDSADYTFTSFNKGSFYSPVQAAHIRKAGSRMLKFWEAPTAAQTLTLHAGLKVMPELYYADPLTAYIHLDSQHNELIKAWVMAKAYQHCKKFDLYRAMNQEFRDTLERKKRNRPMKHKISMVYR